MKEDERKDYEYSICVEGGDGYFEDRKSEFYSVLRTVHSEAEVEELLDGIRKKYYDASHSCYAYIIGDGAIKRCSDAGEPSQTAGRPMMDILESRNLTDVCVVVTRYFGGTLLGTGGLVRAYSGAARDAVEHSVISPRLDGVLVDYTFTYDLYGKLQHYTENHEVYINKSDFSDVVRVRLLMKKGLKESVDKDFSEMSGGKVVPGEVRDCRFIIAGGRPQLTD